MRIGVTNPDIGVQGVVRGAFLEDDGDVFGRMFAGEAQFTRHLEYVWSRSGYKSGQTAADIFGREILVADDRDRGQRELQNLELDDASSGFLCRNDDPVKREAALAQAGFERRRGSLQGAEAVMHAEMRGQHLRGFRIRQRIAPDNLEALDVEQDIRCRYPLRCGRHSALRRYRRSGEDRQRRQAGLRCGAQQYVQ